MDPTRTEPIIDPDQMHRIKPCPTLGMTTRTANRYRLAMAAGHGEQLRRIHLMREAANEAA